MKFKDRVNQEIEVIKDKANDTPRYKASSIEDLKKARIINCIFIAVLICLVPFSNGFFIGVYVIFIIACVRSLLQIRKELKLKLHE